MSTVVIRNSLAVAFWKVYLFVPAKDRNSVQLLFVLGDKLSILRLTLAGLGFGSRGIGCVKSCS